MLLLARVFAVMVAVYVQSAGRRLPTPKTPLLLSLSSRVLLLLLLLKMSAPCHCEWCCYMCRSLADPQEPLAGRA